MNKVQIAALTIVIVYIIIIAFLVYFFILVIKALKKYINAKEVIEEKKFIRKSLGEVLKENRLRCKMTQEFVADTLGVSRQAVSKWENGTSDPSTSNLMALAKLYEVSSEELLRSTDSNYQKEKAARHSK